MGCNQLKFIPAHFVHQRLLRKIHSCLLRESRLQHRFPSDIDGGVKVSVHEFHAFIASGETDVCKDASKSYPPCH